MIIKPREPGEGHAEYAYRVMRTNIMNLEMEPGMVINEKEIAARLGVSRTPIHEAVLRLKNDFLVDIIPRKESKVSYIDIDRIADGFFIRRTMEAAVFKSAIGRVSVDYRRKMQEVLEEQRDIIEHEKWESYLESDDKFHKLIYLAADKPFCYEMVSQSCSHFTRMRYLTLLLSDLDFIVDSYNQHEQMLRMLVFGADPDFDIDEYFTNHMKGFQEVLPGIDAGYSKYFIF